ncbi:type II toxin-antitoxin system RelB/DinJ family antitoxin [Eggerthellaceae bacterium 24-137]
MSTATKDAEIKFRTSDELKRQTRRVYDRWGLTLSEAFNLFMRKSVEVGGLPFDLRPEPSPILSGRETLQPDPVTGVTVLPAWMDSPEDEGLYDDLV